MNSDLDWDSEKEEEEMLDGGVSSIDVEKCETASFFQVNGDQTLSSVPVNGDQTASSVVVNGDQTASSIPLNGDQTASSVPVNGDQTASSVPVNGDQTTGSNPVNGIQTASSVPANGGQTSSTGVDIVVRMLLEITKKTEKEEIYRQKIDSLGITCLSDFEFIDFSSFNDTLLPVEIGKLKHKISNIGVEKNAQNQPEPGVIEVTEIFSSNFIKNVLLSKKRISRTFKIKIAEAVGQELWLKNQKRNVPEKVCLRVATFLTKQYPGALQSPTLKDGSTLSSSIYNHIRYLTKLEKKNHRTVDPSLHPASFTARENIGIDSDRDAPPNLPEGETLPSQLAKKQQLVNMKESGQINVKEVLRLMKATYVSQRHFIQTKPPADKLMEEWPFFGKFDCLQFHFSYLMKLDHRETKYLDKMNSFCPKFIEYVKSEANQKLGSRASATSKENVKTLTDILKRLNKKPVTPSTELSAIILSLGCLMTQQDLSKLFIYFNDTTNLHEVQASPDLPKSGIPIVAVLGTDILMEPKTLVLVDNVVITKPQSPVKSILSVFMLYWVLKIKIPKAIGGVMEFIQNVFFELDVPSRVERVRTKNNKSWGPNPPRRSRKFEKLISKYEDFRSQWDSETE